MDFSNDVKKFFGTMEVYVIVKEQDGDAVVLASTTDRAYVWMDSVLYGDLFYTLSEAKEANELNNFEGEIVQLTYGLTDVNNIIL